MKNSLFSISSIFGMIMIIVVLFLAFGVAFTDMLDDRLYGNKRTFFIVLLFAYAVYRGFRLYQVSRGQHREE
jgi:hypothetical protein